jgi:hypothetical protein
MKYAIIAMYYTFGIYYTLWVQEQLEKENLFNFLIDR